MGIDPPASPALSTLFEPPPTYAFIDPFEIQCFPPREVDEAMESVGVDYPDLLEAIAGLLQTRSPRFAQDLCPFLESYMHEHNYARPLTEAEDAQLRGMIAAPDTMDVTAFERLVPNVLMKACTLATETFVQKRPSWVLKALPKLTLIKKVVIG
ncbi:MAG: hypothetical protein JWM80_6539 [Cyanobacteria bacterium RYN_339]|nr:hypothetical protein [Cyanobacteria bacterium RYN_339]